MFVLTKRKKAKFLGCSLCRTFGSSDFFVAVGVVSAYKQPERPYMKNC